MLELPAAEMIVVRCAARKEFITNAVDGYGPFESHLGGYSHMNSLLFTLLLQADAEPDRFVGRWVGNTIQCFELSIYEGDEPTWTMLCNQHRDLTLEMTYVCRDHKGFRMGDKPTHFRQHLAQFMTLPVSDYRHLWPAQARAACRVAELQARGGSFRQWLLRRQLTDETRRAIGGRPGRIKANRRRAVSRRHRNIKRTDDA